MLGGMTKNVYHGIFQNKSGFTVYDGIFQNKSGFTVYDGIFQNKSGFTVYDFFFFMHNQLFTTSSTS